ncbi:MAG: 2-C-methyl-D-erythritol 4-phosphate cytidylyltransferase [Spirochaetales bacterium]|nr:2-C-methyl-D-erythritol 4-phosphate cytidylyltransferase [Spirochaetales bacterium]
MSCDAVLITAAGSSRRWKDEQKKEYAQLDGRPVLSWTVQAFLEVEPPLQIVVTLPEKDIPKVRKILQTLNHGRPVRMVAGGSSRQESVRLGLESLRDRPPEIVLIHDGARPWIDRALIDRVLEGTRRWGACIPVLEANEAPKRVGPSGLIIEDLPRDRLKLAQTPQGFLYRRILDAHRRARGNPHLFVDDAELYAAYWSAVFTVAGQRRNRKITFKEDLQAP